MLDSGLSLSEYIMDERVPLAAIQRSIFRFLEGRRDAVIHGAQAVNAYVSEPRETQDVDLLSDRAALAEELRAHLAGEFRIAVRVRTVANGRGLCVYQLRRPRPRKLVDIRLTRTFPDVRVRHGLVLIAPLDLAVAKIVSLTARDGTAKGDTDRADLRRLLARFPAMRERVSQAVVAAGNVAVLAKWKAFCG